MPDHVHLIIDDGGRGRIAATFAEAHRRYTGTSTLGSAGRAICSGVALVRW
jgi:hypothetical protein